MSTRNLTVIAALGARGEIGQQGDLPWPRHAEDMARFKNITDGGVCIMGRKTWESIPRPLAGRHEMVLTRREGPFFIEHNGKRAVRVTSLEAAIAHASHALTVKSLNVIGGAWVYRQALPFAKELFLTRFPAEYPQADAFFPEDWTRQGWVKRSERSGKGGVMYEYWVMP